jgi:hypothetical protein
MTSLPLELFERALNTGAHQPGRPVASCANLAPAHTGTATLSHLLHNLSPFTHHDHWETVDALRARGVRCFIVTVRDPVARLKSAYRWMAVDQHWATRATLYKRIRGTLSRLEHTHVNASMELHLADLLLGAVNGGRRLSSVVASLMHLQLHGSRHHGANVAWAPHAVVDAGAWKGLKDSDLLEHGIALPAQVHYLQGLEGANASEPGAEELHFVCTHRMADDWG